MSIVVGVVLSGFTLAQFKGKAKLPRKRVSGYNWSGFRPFIGGFLFEIREFSRP